MSACKGSGVDNSLFLRRLRKGGIHVLSEQTNLKSFRHLPCLLQDAFVHQYHRVRSDKSQELSPTCHGGSAGWYVLVDGLTTFRGAAFRGFLLEVLLGSRTCGEDCSSAGRHWAELPFPAPHSSCHVVKAADPSLVCSQE